MVRFAINLFVAVSLLIAAVPSHFCFAQDDPPEVQIGERLFLETRFAQFFFAHFDGNVNHALASGDPVLSTSNGVGANFPGPFAAESMNCRSCHLVDELTSNKHGGNRTYNDFARRSPIPVRDDGRVLTLRNSPPLVNASLDDARSLLLHFDGEFNSLEDLVIGTFTGRNFGWLPNERSQAIAHIASVIRNDDGTTPLDKEYSSSYRQILGAAGNIPAGLRLPAAYRLDVDTATDDQILRAVAKLVAVYVRGLVFQQNSHGEFSGSPYDLFLSDNRLPRKPKKNESNLEYARRLRSLLSELDSPKYVSGGRQTFKTPFQIAKPAFRFGPTELQGLKVFLREGAGGTGSSGNCVGCHTPPRFTDSSFHNTGVSQVEFDALHGSGSFAALHVPQLEERSENPDVFLPPSESHPAAQGIFASIPAKGDPNAADLGIWNVFANPDISATQSKLEARLRSLSNDSRHRLATAELLKRSLGRFKTPGLRDLGQSGPYMHNGEVNDLIGIVHFYMKMSDASRKGKVRNGDALLPKIHITEKDAQALARFLGSLNEDYE